MAVLPVPLVLVLAPVPLREPVWMSALPPALRSALLPVLRQSAH